MIDLPSNLQILLVVKVIEELPQKRFPEPLHKVNHIVNKHQIFGKLFLPIATNAPPAAAVQDLLVLS
jgi:hypothetical protein